MPRAAGVRGAADVDELVEGELALPGAFEETGTVPSARAMLVVVPGEVLRVAPDQIAMSTTAMKMRCQTLNPRGMGRRLGDTSNEVVATETAIYGVGVSLPPVFLVVAAGNGSSLSHQ